MNTPDGKAPVVSMEAVSRHFGKLTAVDHLDLEVYEGETFGLLGPNGAGKTTTIKMLTTLLPPSDGKASVCGLDVMRRSAEVRKVIGYVPQMLSADGNLTGYENLLIFAKLYEVPAKERKARVLAALELMGLSDFSHRMVRTYSGGMVRRLEMAQSTLHQPKVLFLDEPSIGLDPRARRAVWEIVQSLKHEHGTSIFLTTHLMDEAESLCDRVGIMHKGKLIALGSPAELCQATGSATLDDVFLHFTGDSIESGGNLRDIRRDRTTARRLG